MKITGVVANHHLTAGPVEVHHGTIGEVASVLQPLPGETDEACLNKHTLPLLVTGCQPRSTRYTGTSSLQECGGHATSLRVMTFNL